MKCTVNVSSDEFPTFWVLHKFSCLLHSVIRGNNNSLLGLACYGPYHLIYTHLPHNVEKRLKLSLQKMLFFPQSPQKNSLMNIYIPSENVPCKSHNLLIFWLFCSLPLSNFGLQSYNLQKFHRKFCQRVGRDLPFLFRPPPPPLPMDEYPQQTASRNPFSKGPTKRSKGSDKKVRW